MRIEKLNELRTKNFINENQLETLESILSRKIFSVFYELRTLLYLGVMLFTTGVGILIYLNIGELGHLLSIIALFILTVACFLYSFRYVADYSSGCVLSPTPYFDYVVLLGCLLFISVLGYLQFQYNLFNEGLGATTLVTAIFFFYGAYRFDHAGILSLAVTALASFWSISISPQKWYHGDFFDRANLHITALVFGPALAFIAVGLDRIKIKQHFTFTYVNFGTLIFFTGGLAGLFMEDEFVALYVLLLYAGCGLSIYFANWNKSFLFLLYAFIVAYIVTTYLLSNVMDDLVFWFFYLAVSCGGFVFFIIRFKNYFKRTE